MANNKPDMKEIKELVKFMETHNLLELEIEKEGVRIRLKKSSFQDSAPQISVIPKEEVSPKLKEENTAKANTIEIEAPMVGTFYRASAPDAQPYVEVGDVVAQGEVLCIIEAMKLMNEIKAEKKVKIVDILIENGDPVEFGQPIFLAEPA